MKPAPSLKRALEKIRRLAAEARYERAFAEAEKLLHEWPDNPQVLVTWANLLQMQEADVGPPLEKAKAALQRAVDLDEQAPLPIIELGQYLFALDDDSKEASKLFARAISLSKRLLTDALICQAKTLIELGRRAEGMSCLAEAYWLQARHGKTENGATSAELLERFEELVKTE